MAAFMDYPTATSATSTVVTYTSSSSNYSTGSGSTYQGGMADPRSSEQIARAEAEKLELMAKEAKKVHRERSMNVPYQSKFANGVGHKAPQRCRSRPREDGRRPLGRD